MKFLTVCSLEGTGSQQSLCNITANQTVGIGRHCCTVCVCDRLLMHAPYGRWKNVNGCFMSARTSLLSCADSALDAQNL